jgi:hypothetical protein
MYSAEVEACQAVGIPYAVIQFEALIAAQPAEKIVRRVPEQEHAQVGIYRGWMLRPEHYTRLYEALQTRGITLINDPSAYRHCHHLPESYAVIEDYTPGSVWTKDLSIETIMDLLRPFGSARLIVKDYVKSQKHYWNEACFIPSAADRSAVERVVSRFLDLQGEDLNEGLVFRRFVDLEPLASHSKSGMPLTKEFRVFVLDGSPLLTTEYWEEGDYAGVSPALDSFREVMRAVHSRFYTMDIAQKRDGQWIITELGDAQVAGLLGKIDPLDFYRGLSASLQ